MTPAPSPLRQPCTDPAVVLPADLFRRVLLHLPVADLLACAGVSERWRVACQDDPVLWRAHCARQGWLAPELDQCDVNIWRNDLSAPRDRPPRPFNLWRFVYMEHCHRSLAFRFGLAQANYFLVRQAGQRAALRGLLAGQAATALLPTPESDASSCLAPGPLSVPPETHREDSPDTRPDPVDLFDLDVDAGWILVAAKDSRAILVSRMDLGDPTPGLDPEEGVLLSQITLPDSPILRHLAKSAGGTIDATAVATCQREAKASPGRVVPPTPEGISPAGSDAAAGVAPAAATAPLASATPASQAEGPSNVPPGIRRLLSWFDTGPPASPAAPPGPGPTGPNSTDDLGMSPVAAGGPPIDEAQPQAPGDVPPAPPLPALEEGMPRPESVRPALAFFRQLGDKLSLILSPQAARAGRDQSPPPPPPPPAAAPTPAGQVLALPLRRAPARGGSIPTRGPCLAVRLVSLDRGASASAPANEPAAGRSIALTGDSHGWLSVTYTWLLPAASSAHPGPAAAPGRDLFPALALGGSPAHVALPAHEGPLVTIGSWTRPETAGLDTARSGGVDVLIATGGFDTMVHIWTVSAAGRTSTPELRQLCTLAGHASDIYCSVFLRFPATLELFAPEYVSQQQGLVPGERSIPAAIRAAYSHGGLPLVMTCSFDRSVRLWRLHPEEETAPTELAVWLFASPVVTLCEVPGVSVSAFSLVACSLSCGKVVFVNPADPSARLADSPLLEITLPEGVWAKSIATTPLTEHSLLLVDEIRPGAETEPCTPNGGEDEASAAAAAGREADARLLFLGGSDGRVYTYELRSLLSARVAGANSPGRLAVSLADPSRQPAPQVAYSWESHGHVVTGLKHLASPLLAATRRRAPGSGMDAKRPAAGPNTPRSSPEADARRRRRRRCGPAENGTLPGTAALAAIPAPAQSVPAGWPTDQSPGWPAATAANTNTTTTAAAAAAASVAARSAPASVATPTPIGHLLPDACMAQLADLGLGAGPDGDTFLVSAGRDGRVISYTADLEPALRRRILLDFGYPDVVPGGGGPDPAAGRPAALRV